MSCALFDLAKLYSSKGFSLKADDAQSRAQAIKHGSNHSQSLHKDSGSKEDCGSHNLASSCNGNYEDGSSEKCSKLADEGCSDDDWEAVADRAPDELLSPQSLPGVSKVHLEDTKVQTSKRRGRGTFSYQKHGLYSDQQSDGLVVDNSESEAASHNPEGDAGIREFKYGTRHALVLADFPPSMKTTDLEKLFVDFKDQGVVIRWVNDTTALAVFRSPSIALYACNCIQCPFTVRVLDENDEFLSSIQDRDLEPPRPRPKTSARTAERLIAHGMGLKLPSKNFGSRELRKQEEDRKNRIVSRQHMRDDAWGDEVN